MVTDADSIIRDPALPVEIGICLTGLADRPDALTEVLSSAERRRYREIAHPRRRRQYLASRWLLRQHVGQLLGRSAGDLRVEFPPGRAPKLPGESMRLGLSHSADLCVVVVVCGAQGGCDVEQHRRRRRMNRLAAEYFAPSEAEYLSRLEGAALLSQFYRLWTLKEASRKALNQGIADGIGEPSFAWDRGFHCIQAPTPGIWTFWYSEPAPAPDGYSLAVAVRAKSLAARASTYHPDSGGAQRRPAALKWRSVRWERA